MSKSESPGADSPKLKPAAMRFLKNGARLEAEGTGKQAVEAGVDPWRTSTVVAEPTRRPFSTRIRTDLYARLKRISLTRELERTSPHHLAEILEAAVEVWLADNE